MKGESQRVGTTSPRWNRPVLLCYIYIYIMSVVFVLMLGVPVRD